MQYLIGGCLQQICFGAYDVQLRFDNDLVVTAMHAIEFSSPEGDSIRIVLSDGLTTPVTFHHPLNRTVNAIEVWPLRLAMVFDDRSIVAVETDVGAYEACTIAFRRIGEDGAWLEVV